MIVFDLNVCLYVVNIESAHHAAVKNCFERTPAGEELVGFPWIVILGFLRISTNRRIFPTPLAPEQAMSVIDGWISMPIIQALNPRRDHWRVFKSLLGDMGTAANLKKDVHLAALAIENGAKLYSFGRDFMRFPRLKCVHPEA
ncbi:MAG: TA system VapC family ribonuclease toxin [Verrucomicrobiota bacterium]